MASCLCDVAREVGRYSESFKIQKIVVIEDAYGESPPPPAFLEAPMWPKIVLQLGQAIGPCVPRVGLENLRGTRGGEIRRGGEGENRRREGEASWEPVVALLGPKVVLELGQGIGPCVPRVGLESLRETRG